jgi:imidazolonepropionase-like amidohydrolase
VARTLITNAVIFDATGAKTFAGDLLVDGNRIASVGPSGQAGGQGFGGQQDDRVIDAAGRFLMPGMTEGHAHLSFENVCATENLITPTPEAQVFTAARGAKALIEAGFTSSYGASEAKLRLAVAVRNEVNAGRLPGPRIRAGGLELSVTGAMGDESKEHDLRPGGPSQIVDGVDEMRKAVRFQIREGIDNIKLDVSGDPFYPSTPGNSTPMTFEEIKVAADTAHGLGRKINAHTRSVEGSKHCVRAGVDGLFHCEFSDEEMFDLMEEAKDRIFVSPTVGLLHQIMTGEAAGSGLSAEVGGYMGIGELLENSAKTHSELRKRGIRHLIGGDYGFGWSRQGEQGKDIALFMHYYGYSAEEALLCATRNGGLAMMGDGSLGTLEVGKLADLILVNGNVLEDVSLLSDGSKVDFVMRDGLVQKIAASLSSGLSQSIPSPALEAAE